MFSVTYLAVSITIHWEFHPQQWSEEMPIKVQVTGGDQGRACGVNPQVVVAMACGCGI